MTSTARVSERLEEATRDHRLLDHPFYKAWTEGSLTTDDLAFYAGQYWRQVEAFPGYLETLADRLEGSPAREVLLENLADERDGDHAELWLRFAEAVGAPRDQVASSAAEPETRKCVEAFEAAARDASPAFALGMLYGYESQTPAVAQTKLEGLRAHWGIEGEGARYFDLHATLDVEHSQELAAAIAAFARDESSLEEASAGARAGALAVSGLLDGVARARELAVC